MREVAGPPIEQPSGRPDAARRRAPRAGGVGVTTRAAARWTLLAFLLVAVTGVLLRPLAPIDETRYVAVAWEMWQSGDFLVPTKNFELYTHKPPLLFWIIYLVWALTGVNEFAARLVGPLCAALAILLTGLLGRRLWPDDADIGSRTVMILSGMTIFAVLGGLTMFDALLSVATLAGLLALLTGVDTGARRWWVVLGAALAIGVLAKGPVILVHLGPAILAVPIWARGRGAVGWAETVRAAGIALVSALGILALWLVPAIFDGGPAYRDAILWTQSAGRISQSFAHARPWWFFVALLPVLLYPWIFLPAAWAAARAARWSEPGLRLCAIWGASALVLFSLISGKQAHYLMPELPAAALVLARLLRDRPSFRLVHACLPALAAALVAIAAAAGQIDLGAAARLFQPSTALLAWALFVLAVAWSALRSGGLQGGVMLGLGIVLSANLLIGRSEVSRIYDTGRIAEIVAPYQDEGIAYVGPPYNAEFNFAGRLTSPVAEIGDERELSAWLASHSKGVVLGPTTGAALPWEPRYEIPFGGTTYAIWWVTDARKEGYARSPHGPIPASSSLRGRPNPGATHPVALR